MMPGMSGVEMAVLIRERHPACKVLLFSGNASTVDMLEEVRRQGHDFELLAKPIYPTDLLAKIASVSRESEVELKPTPQAGLNSVKRAME